MCAFAEDLSATGGRCLCAEKIKLEQVFPFFTYFLFPTTEEDLDLAATHCSKFSPIYQVFPSVKRPYPLYLFPASQVSQGKCFINLFPRSLNHCIKH